MNSRVAENMKELLTEGVSILHKLSIEKVESGASECQRMVFLCKIRKEGFSLYRKAKALKGKLSKLGWHMIQCLLPDSIFCFGKGMMILFSL